MDENETTDKKEEEKTKKNTNAQTKLMRMREISYRYMKYNEYDHNKIRRKKIELHIQNIFTG